MKDDLIRKANTIFQLIEKTANHFTVETKNSFLGETFIVSIRKAIDGNNHFDARKAEESFIKMITF